MYAGRRRIAARISSHVNSEVAAEYPVPSATATPRRLQASTSMCGPTLPVWLMIRRFGRRASSASVIRVRSRVRTRASASRRRTASWPRPAAVAVSTRAS